MSENSKIDLDNEIRELEAKYKNQIEEEKKTEKQEEKTEEHHLSPYLEYLQKKYTINFPADIQFQNQLLFAIFCELVEIKTSNEEAREFIKKEKGDVK